MTSNDPSPKINLKNLFFSTHNLTIKIIFILGIILIFFAFRIGERRASVLDPSLSVARAEPLFGQSRILRHGANETESLTSKRSLGHLDSIETDNLSEVRISLGTLDRIRILENSLVTIEKINLKNNTSTARITIKRGQIEIENVGSVDNVLIAKNGEQLEAGAYASSDLAKTNVENPIPRLQDPAEVLQTKNLQIINKQKVLNKELSQEEIQSEMTNLKNSFLRCYAKLLQKAPQSKGKVTLSFTIENSGKVLDAQSTSNEIKNQEFQSCLVEVVKRSEFRRFSGPAISTYYPLDFN